MHTWITDFLFPSLLAIITGGVGYIVHILKEDRKINNANAKGTMLLLRREIVEYHKRCCQDGEPLTSFHFSDLTEIHEAYKTLGGNGLTDKMYEELLELPIQHD